MSPKITLLFCTLLMHGACTQIKKQGFDPKADEAAIRAVLEAEQIAWNNGDIDAFMEGYWKSDSLQFMSPRGVNHGWQETLDAYKKGYPDIRAMGTLHFDIFKVTPLSGDHYLVTGQYHVTRNSDNLDGYFTLIFEKIDGKWVAIYDHTS
jgi:ketosteroid isomerase-like protein